MNRLKIALFAVIVFSLNATSVLADSVIINNNVGTNKNNSDSNNRCQNSDSSGGNSGTQPGVYTERTPRGSNTIYSTGTKKPFLPDNNCNSQVGVPQPQVIIPFKHKHHH